MSKVGFQYTTNWFERYPVPALICPDAITSHPGLLRNQYHENGFLSAVLFAFNHHLPLTLRPEHFWILILQTVSLHVNSNSEKLRSKFVTHKGKKKIEISRDDFVLGEKGNDWAGAVREFGQQISQLTLPDTAALLATDFSSSSSVEVVAGQVTIMDMVKDFFRFCIFTKCGFPEITLEGTSEDWHRLRSKSQALIRRKCLSNFSNMWLPALLSVLDRLVEQYDNPTVVDVTFWESFCKEGGGQMSGRKESIDGWVNVFFPVLRHSAINLFSVPYGSKIRRSPRLGHDPGKTGADYDILPSGMASAPVAWKYYDAEIQLEFRSGFVGAVLRPDGSVSPDVGWYISKKEGLGKNKKRRRLF